MLSYTALYYNENFPSLNICGFARSYCTRLVLSCLQVFLYNSHVHITSRCFVFALTAELAAQKGSRDLAAPRKENGRSRLNAPRRLINTWFPRCIPYKKWVDSCKGHVRLRPIVDFCALSATSG
jgi:hypothetical protein